ncbi:oxygen-insensitive NADPH nitroreductase [Schinkia sp. CFF1]
MNEILKVMSNHRSIRHYLDKDIPNEMIGSIIEAAQWASTSSNVQAYSIIMIRDYKRKERLAELCGNQKHVSKCPVFLVFCGDFNRIFISSKIQNVEQHLDTVEPFLVASVDAALIAQNVMLAAESFGLGGVYIGGIRNNSKEVSELLNLPDFVYPVFGMCLGYPDQEKIPEQKPRLPLHAILHEELYQNDRQENCILEYDHVMKDYYETRSSGNRSETWSEYVSKIYQAPRRAHLRGFIEGKGFGFK